MNRYKVDLVNSLALPLIKMPSRIKMIVMKKPIVSSISFSIFAYNRMNNNIDPGGPGPLNSIFAYQLKCILTMNLRVFIQKVATSGPHLTFS